LNKLLVLSRASRPATSTAPPSFNDYLEEIGWPNGQPCREGAAHYRSMLLWLPSARSPRPSRLNKFLVLSRASRPATSTAPLSFRDYLEEVGRPNGLPCHEGAAHRRSLLLLLPRARASRPSSLNTFLVLSRASRPATSTAPLSFIDYLEEVGWPHGIGEAHDHPMSLAASGSETANGDFYYGAGNG
jgi:hypothetical protein